MLREFRGLLGLSHTSLETFCSSSACECCCFGHKRGLTLLGWSMLGIDDLIIVLVILIRDFERYNRLDFRWLTELGSLIIIAIWTKWPGKIKVIKAHVGIPIVTSEPISKILLIDINTEVKIKAEDPEIVNIDLAMGKLINGPKDLDEWIITEAHKLLLKWFNRFDTCNFFFKYFNHSEFNIVRQLDSRIMQGVLEILLGTQEVRFGLIWDWGHKFCQIKQRKLAVGIRVECID